MTTPPLPPPCIIGVNLDATNDHDVLQGLPTLPPASRISPSHSCVATMNATPQAERALGLLKRRPTHELITLPTVLPVANPAYAYSKTDTKRQQCDYNKFDGCRDFSADVLSHSGESSNNHGVDFHGCITGYSLFNVRLPNHADQPTVRLLLVSNTYDRQC